MSAATMTEEHLLTVNEVSKILRMGVQTVRRMLKSGELKAFKVRDEWRIRASDLEAFMQRGKEGSN